MIYSYTSKIPGRLTQFLATIDAKTGATIKNKPKWLKKGDFAQL
jgi:hypothetical protein